MEIPDNLVERYFQIGEIFTQWEFIDISEEKIDLYSIKDLTIGEGGEDGKYEGVMYRAYLDLYKNEGGEFNNSKLIRIYQAPRRWI